MEFLFVFALFSILFGITFFLAKKVRNGFSPKKALKIHFATFGLIIGVSIVAPFVVNAAGNSDPSQTTEVIAKNSDNISSGLAMLGAAATFGLSALGAGMALSNSTPSAITAMSENPSTFGKSLVLVALAESLPILGMVVSLIIITKF